MKFEFNQGMPAGCFNWLRANVGLGNIEEINGRTQQWTTDLPEYAWFYERIKKPVRLETVYDDPWKYVPTVTIKEPKLATLFALTWEPR